VSEEEELGMAFFPLEKCDNVYDGYQKAFDVDGQMLLLLQVDGQLFLVENRCPHMDVALTDAIQLDNARIRCRAHGIAFSLESGKAEGPLAGMLDCLKRFPIEIQGKYVGLQINN